LYCPLPFRHVYVDNSGLAPCCQFPRQVTTLDQWANNPTLQRIQQSFLSGQVPPECQTCIDQEQSQGESLRTNSLRDYNNQRFDDTEIDFVDYRSSNICNFRCRSCVPEFSHGIAQEYKQIPELSRFGRVIDIKVASADVKNKDWIINHLSQLRRLMFTGGEPTVIPEVRSILEHVLDANLPDLSVLITTNGSFTDPFWYELTKHCKQIHWTVSVDAVGYAAEIIRDGTDWAQVHSNLNWLACHAQSMDINTVISNLNVFQLQPLLRYVRNLQLLSQQQGQMGSDGIRHQFFQCRRPYYLAADNWPDDLRRRVLTYLQQCLALNLDSIQQDTIEHLLNSVLFNQFDSELWSQCQIYNDILDQSRNQNHMVLYQEI
jgi:sulfatase maturation enzyme AslB (radical SAM superfamily)